MKVEIRGWDRKSALAGVDGVKVRVTYRGWWLIWKCDECGEFEQIPGCVHTAALAATYPPDNKQQAR